MIDTPYDWVGYLIIFSVGLMITFALSSGKIFGKMIGLTLTAYLARALGALARYYVLKFWYRGIGDASGYFRYGAKYAESVWQLDFTFLSRWRGGRWWGTQTVAYISTFVCSVIGPTMRGEFLLFSILSFFGLFLFCKAFRNNYPQSDLKKYAVWV